MVSIAMATYNGEKYLREQIDSILKQTIQDFELIICDDCSTDTTWDILQEYQLQDARIKCYRNEENLGFKKNFEKAIMLCTGEYIALSDQDDIWKDNHLQLLLKNIEGRDLSVGNADIIDGIGNMTGKRLNELDRYFHDPSGTEKMYSVLITRSIYQGASMLFRSELKKVIIPIPEFVEYHDAWISCCAVCNRGIFYTYTPITNYRLHGTNISLDTHQKKSLLHSGFNFIFKKQNSRNQRIFYVMELENRLNLICKLNHNKKFTEIKEYLNSFNCGKNYIFVKNFFDEHYESMYYCNDRSKFLLRKIVMCINFIKNRFRRKAFYD